jgi:hypothetical protein
VTQRAHTAVALAGTLVVLAGIVVVCVAAASVRLLVPMPATVPLWVGAGGALVGAVIGALAPKAKSRVGLVLGLAMLLAMLGGFGTALAMRILDVVLDGAPTEHHVCTVVRRWEEERKTRHGTRDVYFVALEGCPRFPGDARRLLLPLREFKHTRVGESVVLVTRPGWLGYPYLVAAETARGHGAQ